MRDIRFREWDQAREDMMSGHGISYSVRKDSDDEVSFVFAHYESDENWKDNHRVLEQYIGRRDINDKEIFEGDIVSVDVQDYPAGYAREIIFIGVIVFEESTCDFCVKLLKRPEFHGEEFPSEICGLPVSGCDDYEYDCFWFDDSVNDEDIEVIGNIHENPELLEVD